MNNTITVNADNFASEVLESTVPVLVDFWAPWCGPCKMLAPILDELGADFAGRAKIVKVNTEEAADLAARFNVQALPTMVFFFDGKELERVVGTVPIGGLMPLTEFERQHGGQRLPVFDPASVSTSLTDVSRWYRDVNFTATSRYTNRRIMEEGVDAGRVALQ